MSTPSLGLSTPSPRHPLDWSVCLLALKHLVSLQARVRPSVQTELDLHTTDRWEERDRKKRKCCICSLKLLPYKRRLAIVFFFLWLYRSGVSNIQCEWVCVLYYCLSYSILPGCITRCVCFIRVLTSLIFFVKWSFMKFYSISSLKEVKWSFREVYDLIIIFVRWSFMKFRLFLVKWLSENRWTPTLYTGVVQKIYWIVYKVNRCKYSKLGSLQTSSSFSSSSSSTRASSPWVRTQASAALNSDKGVFGSRWSFPHVILLQTAVRAPVILLVVYDLGALGGKNRGMYVAPTSLTGILLYRIVEGLQTWCKLSSSVIKNRIFFFWGLLRSYFFRSLPPDPRAPHLHESWGCPGFEISFNFTKTSSRFTNFTESLPEVKFVKLYELHEVSPESSWTSRDPLMKSKPCVLLLFTE